MLNGDKSAFREIFDSYHALLFKFCARYRGLERVHVADIVQQTFMKAFQNINKLKDENLLGSWIFMIARNEVVSHIRKQKQERLSIGKIVNDPAINSQDDPYIREQIFQSLENAVEEVADPVSKDIADLYYGPVRITTQEIAEKLDIPKGTVTTKLRRLRLRLHRNMLQKLLEHGIPWCLSQDLNPTEPDEGATNE
jgi:RNA polymerase sigma-70 factor (ECF subfamily)